MPVKSLPLRQLGKNGPNVPAIGFGLMVLAGAYGAPGGDDERFQVLDRAAELGETFWDTSDIYGDNEEMLGKWFKRTGKRNEIFLASKFGIVMGPNLQFKGFNSTAEYCKQACEDSLKKLGTDYIDLYYAHRLDPETPVEVTMRALAELKREGKIRHIGLSAVSSTTLRRACKIAPVAAVQMEYSPFVLDIEGETGKNLLETCKELGVAVVCYAPLGRGLLTGALTTRESVTGKDGGIDIRGGQMPRFSEENLDANIKIVNQFKTFADKKSCTSAQLSLAWILKQNDGMIPIPGTKKIKYLEENLASLDIQLTDAEEAEVRMFVESAEMAGSRETLAGMAFAYVDTKEES